MDAGLKRKLAGAAAGVAIAAGAAGVADAVSGGSGAGAGPADGRQALLNDVAKRLNVPPQKLKDAFAAALAAHRPPYGPPGPPRPPGPGGPPPPRPPPPRPPAVRASPARRPRRRRARRSGEVPGPDRRAALSAASLGQVARADRRRPEQAGPGAEGRARRGVQEAPRPDRECQAWPAAPATAARSAALPPPPVS